MTEDERVALWDVRAQIDKALECLRVGERKVTRPDTAAAHLRQAVKLLGRVPDPARGG